MSDLTPETIVRVDHRTRFTVVETAAIEDPRLDFHARGILLYLLSRPPGWRVRVRDLCSQTREAPRPCGRDSVLQGLRTLESAGYLERRRIRENGAFVGLETIVHERTLFPRFPREFPQTGTPDTGTPPPENPSPSNEGERINSLSPAREQEPDSRLERETLGPPSLRDVLDVAATTGVRSATAEEFFYWAEAQVPPWTDGQGVSILSVWRFRLKLWGVRADSGKSFTRGARRPKASHVTRAAESPNWNEREDW